MTKADIDMFEDLKKAKKNIVIVLSKIDRITQKEFHKNIQAIETITGDTPLFQVSSKNTIGIDVLVEELLA